jgi:DNA-binding XRE family transcriptional regulator
MEGNELGKRILEYRARHDMTQEEFAIKARLNVMTVNTIENGKRKPTKLTHMKIEQIIKEDEQNEI